MNDDPIKVGDHVAARIKGVEHEGVVTDLDLVKWIVRVAADGVEWPCSLEWVRKLPPPSAEDKLRASTVSEHGE